MARRPSPLSGYVDPGDPADRPRPGAGRAGRPRGRGRLVVVILLLAILGVGGSYMGIRSTLASSVTINSGSSVEFGQGSVPMIACDTSIDTSISQAWSSSSSSFRVATVILSNLNKASSSANNGGCGGKDISVSLVKSDGSLLAIGTGSQTSVTVTVPTSDGSATTSAGGFSASISGSTLTITLAAGVSIAPGDVSRLALTTSA